jgi:predicted peroxiredoxin
MATTALASDIDVLLGFQGNGAFLVMQGTAEHVAAPGFPPLAELLQGYVAAGGRMYVCGTCLGTRRIGEAELVAGATIVGAATFVAECAAANNVLVY